MRLAAPPPLNEVMLARMRDAWRTMPGLRLTLAGAMALWGLDALTCDIALRVLIEEGTLVGGPDERVRLRSS